MVLSLGDPRKSLETWYAPWATHLTTARDHLVRVTAFVVGTFGAIRKHISGVMPTVSASLSCVGASRNQHQRCLLQVRNKSVIAGASRPTRE